MNDRLPTFTPEQLQFAERMGREMAPLINAGTDMLDAERIAAKRVAEAMIVEGAGREMVEVLLQGALERSDVGQVVRHNETPVSIALHDDFIAAFKRAGGRRLSPIGLLVEKRANTITGYPLILYSNESQHPGRPHVTIILGDKRVNVTIEANPVVLAGDKRARGLTPAIKAVGEHHEALLREWDETRPDDQKIENFKRRK